MTPAAAVLLSFAFSVPSLLKLYVFAHGFTSQKGWCACIRQCESIGNNMVDVTWEFGHINYTKNYKTSCILVNENC